MFTIMCKKKASLIFEGSLFCLILPEYSLLTG